MSDRLRRALAAALAVGATLAIAALSRLPYQAATDEHALLRLSWRASGEYVEECRRLTAEELEELPVHMRREEICEGRIVPYRLTVALNGQTAVSETVRAAGAREDRPLYVFRDLPLAPGEYLVQVRWEQESSAAGTAGAAPGRLELEATLRLQAGDISLITYDGNRRTLAAAGRGVLRAEAR